MNLRQKTISGLTWSFLDNFIIQGVQFVVGIILARLLTPSEFGLIGMITIFIAVSQTFIDSGFSQALVRKQDCTDEDFNTVFYFNLVTGIVLYLIIFLFAPLISEFFKEPQLIEIVRVLSLVLIISSFGIVQTTKLTKIIDIKTQTKISLTSNILSGIIAIYLASTGFGVWSLVWRSLLSNLISVTLLWFMNSWYPRIVFSKKSFQNMFSFGSKLLASSLLNTLFDNIYYVVIGKYFSPQVLGYYTRAVNFGNLPSSNVTKVIQRVSYPVLSQVQNNQQQLKSAFKKLIKSTMLISFVLMIGMSAVAEPLILTLIGEKWRPTIHLLQLLCFALMLYPLHALNLNILNVKGRSDLFLKLEIIKKILAVPVILTGIFFSVELMIVSMIIHSIAAFFLNSYYSGTMIQYPIKEQVYDIAPSFIIALICGTVLYLINILIHVVPIEMLIIQIVLGVIIIVSFCEFFKLDSYLDIKQIVISKSSKLI